jgi:hypothetical protein
MRSREFTINVPITITINDDEDPVVNTDADQDDGAELHHNPVMVSPQQQELELAKSAAGKSSPVIDKLTQPDDIGAEPEGDAAAEVPMSIDDQIIQRLRSLISR